jgi:hypothetical protein
LNKLVNPESVRRCLNVFNAASTSPSTTTTA